MNSDHLFLNLQKSMTGLVDSFEDPLVEYIG